MPMIFLNSKNGLLYNFKPKHRPLSWNWLADKAVYLFFITFGLPFLVFIIWGFVELGFAAWFLEMIRS